MKRVVPALLAASSLYAGTDPAPLSTIASDTKSSTPIIQPAGNDNPLSFFNGALVFDFEERLRFEDRNNNFDFNDAIKSKTDGSWLLDRTRVGMKFTPSDYFTFYVQGQSSYEFGDDRGHVPGVNGAEGNDPANLHQAYVLIGPKNFNVTIGRQILAYGDERLVGGFDWNNFSRVFDAVKIHYAGDSWVIDAFTSSVVAPTNGQFDMNDLYNGTGVTRGQVFSGVYFSTTGLIPVQTTDLYAFELHELGTDFVTLGTRMKDDPKKLNGFMYETEMAAQFGTFNHEDISAFAGHYGIGYTALNVSWSPSVMLQYNYASPEFQNLFPTNHGLYGNMDLFAWQNMQETAITFTVHPCDTVTAKVGFQADWVADTSDPWYRANGTTVVRPVKASADPFQGTELDTSVTWNPCKHLSLQAGYSHFFAGDYLKATGANSDADFTYVMMTVKF